ncbi:DUF6545 domain-containing protein [Streptomyces mirabilis]|uniref:DUF6545 domain-containing protein n=1 Tax=Streptomyces mirabilis TaxID=68239 RepID=UPI00167C5609|nr:DUF6545 domain-containing protein [Streptomyces mirabilis]GHD49061.1 hypothetical protein GCM10010317_027340 [Streptomyces mirabilis]
MNGDFGFYFSGGLLLLACLLKLPALIRARGRDWLLSSICALLLIGAGVLLTAAPSSIVFLNRVTGVTNIAAVSVYILLTSFSGASIVLVLNWRGGPDVNQTRRLSRITIAIYGTCCVLIAGLFWLGNADVEQIRKFDAYYATTPFIREMIVLYVLAHAAASLTASRLCWRWSHEVHGTLRTGLRVLAAGYLMHYAGYDPAVMGTVAARWAGANCDFLIDIARATTAPSAVLVSVGFIIPLLGPRSEEAVRYCQLAPLARAVRPVQGAPSPVTLRIPWWKPNLRLRLTQRQTYISDRIVICRDYFDIRIRNEARAAALAGKATEEAAAVIAEAAMIAAAVELHRSANGQNPLPPPSAESARSAFSRDLAHISRALRSPIVKNISRRTRTETASV